MLGKYMEDKNHTTIMVTHDPAIMHFANKAILVRDGHVVGEKDIKNLQKKI
jgi:ABC-type lipoprotein export system ATPase subunit